MELNLKKYVLQLKHTFTISRESHDTQDTLIACLSKGAYTGYGESTSNPYYKVTFESMRTEIEAVKDEIENFDFTTPESFHEFLCTKELSNFSICALDQAAHDLYGKLQGKPLYEIWGTDFSSYPRTNFTIGLGSIPKMVQKIEEQPWPLYKVKLGTDHDIEIIRELRKHTDSAFRVDANCAWEAEKAIVYCEVLKELGVEFVEQPLRADDWEGMKLLKEKAVLPLIADESCIVEEDVEKCAGYFDGVNIKLTKCGGLTPALRMIKNARKLGLKVMVGCMTESTVGISAVAQLLPQIDYVDMDGAMLIKNDIAEGVRILEDASIEFPEINGAGVKLLE